MDYQKLIESMTPDVYQRLKRALELGKWPDGKALDAGQKQTCMEAIINWESRHLCEEDRTGYIDRGSKAVGETCGDEQVLTITGTGKTHSNDTLH